MAIHYIGDAVHADGGTQLPNPQEMAIVTRTLIPEMCTMACKVQSLYLLDISVNGLSKDDKSIVNPPPHPVLKCYTSTREDIISRTLSAVFEHHSNLALIQTLTTAALSRFMRAAVPIPAVAAASVSHSAAVGGSVVGVVGLL